MCRSALWSETGVSLHIKTTKDSHRCPAHLQPDSYLITIDQPTVLLHHNEEHHINAYYGTSVCLIKADNLLIPALSNVIDLQLC